jgi:hypothetical protein
MAIWGKIITKANPVFNDGKGNDRSGNINSRSLFSYQRLEGIRIVFMGFPC